MTTSVAPPQSRLVPRLFCAFAIAGCDDRRVNVKEILFLEETMDSKGHTAAHPEDAAQKVRART
jgi:hypothetical protein